MNRSIVYALLIAAATSVSAPAFAQDRDDRGTARAAQSGEWLPMSEIAARLTRQGYRIKEIERDDGVYEVEVRTERGREVELYVDPRTGEIIGRDD